MLAINTHPPPRRYIITPPFTAMITPYPGSLGTYFIFKSAHTDCSILALLR